MQKLEAETDVQTERGNPLMQEKLENSAKKLEDSVGNIEGVVDVVQKAASGVEKHVTYGIQPDIAELRIYLSELKETADIRQMRLLWGVWILIAVNLLTLLVVVLTR